MEQICLTKYVTKRNSAYACDNIGDDLVTLELVDDAAYQSDNTCRMPTTTDFTELRNNTTSTLETLNGVNGMRFTSNTNYNSIFIPYGGYCFNGVINDFTSNGHLWCATSIDGLPSDAYSFNLGSKILFNTPRVRGCNIRAVKP